MNAADWPRVFQSEATCFGWCQTSLDRPEAHYLFDGRLPNCGDANRAFRPRTVDGSAHHAAAEICRCFSSFGRRVVVDVDPVAEEQGVGAALRSRGVMPVTGRMVLMGLAALPAVAPACHADCEIRVLRAGQPGMRDWYHVAAAGSGDPDPAPWAAFVAEQEASLPLAVYYLALWNGSPAGACLRIDHDGWARIESVAVLPECRRKGIARAMVRRACEDPELAGSRVTWLMAEGGSPAEQLYAGLGFSVWAVRPMHRHIGPA
ncbi:MAG: GNAT family N-acetyltransferase [Armatimonadetes bacterium]|nr:GNAT family N-acetyltransferase [Armatimonadota bacterium]MDE2206198.1 GNAT family N-acetyltransferase [Armatimonadota bacterium]